MRFAGGLHEVGMRLARGLHEVCMRLARGLHEVCMRLALIGYLPITPFQMLNFNQSLFS